MKAGFIGLGHLGRAMAGRLASQGVDLFLWNKTREKADLLGRELGLPVAESPAALAEKNEVIFLNLFDSSAVRSVLQGEGGLLAGGLRGKLVIDTTTNHFTDVAEFHDLISSRGGSYLEAPVLGSVVPASAGKAHRPGQRGEGGLRQSPALSGEAGRQYLLPGRARPGDEDEAGQ